MEGRILKLISALRASGVRVSLAESAEAFSAVDLMGILRREDFRLSLRATLIKNAQDLAVFDKLFPLFFGSGQPPAGSGNLAEDLTPEEARMLAEALRNFSDKLRQNLERLLSGEPLTPEQLEKLARMVGLNNVDDLNYQNWMTQRMERALDFPEVREAIKQLMDQLREMGLDGKRLQQLRGQLQERLRDLQGQLENFAGQRIAENLSQRSPSERVDDLMNRSFQNLSEEEKRLLMHEVKRLAAALRTRIALRQKRARSGNLDAKATIRANLKYHGVPLELRHRSRVKKPRIIVICDVSTSMRFCSELMLSFIYALQGQVRKTYAFAFINHLEYISEDFNGKDGNTAIASILRRMPAGSYNTDLGWSLNNFCEDYLDTVNGQSTLIVVGDGRNNYNNPRLDLFKQMSRRAARTLWLSPEAPELWGTGDSDMPGYAALCDSVLRVSNLKELTSAIDHLMVA